MFWSISKWRGCCTKLWHSLYLVCNSLLKVIHHTTQLPVTLPKLLFSLLSPCFDLGTGKLPPSAWNKVEYVSAKHMIYIHNDRPAFEKSPLWLHSGTYVSVHLIKEQFCSSLHMLPDDSYCTGDVAVGCCRPLLVHMERINNSNSCISIFNFTVLLPPGWD